MSGGMALTEWLLSLGSRDAHRKLLEEAGSLPAAAWRLAKARCVTAPMPSEVPTTRELRGAAREIARHAGLGDEVPTGTVLASECEAMGLLVIG
ncbi:Hypothetical protein I5071_3260 [Sandaracinus amylolyticus]|nr:Hypothetical protein I5071_3260 [Sandaracinus amylolyticus]